MTATLRTEAFRRSLGRLAQGVDAIVQDTVLDAAEGMATDARATKTWKDKTSATRASLQAKRVSTYRARFVANGIARLLNSGTRAHVITAKSGGFLRFVQNGAVRFARRVNHPGTKATHFIDTARSTAETALRTTLDRRLNEAIRSTR